jgi:hypothetical protein
MDTTKLIEFFMNQNNELNNQVSALTILNKELQDKIYVLLNNNCQPNNNELSKNDIYLANELTKLKQGNDNWNKFINQIPLNHINMNDLQFCEIGFVDCYFQIIRKLLNTFSTRIINTIDKRHKTVCVFNDDKWINISFLDFVEDIKKLVSKIEKALIKNCLLSKEQNCDEQMVIMMDNISKYKESIAKRVVEYCIIL